MKEETRLIGAAICLAMVTIGCTDQEPATGNPVSAQTETNAEKSDMNAEKNDNPFFIESPLYLQYPQFDKIKDEHYMPALKKGMAEQLANVAAITGNPESPTFENTLVELEKSRQLLDRVNFVFGAMTSANTNDTLDGIRTELAPLRSAHNDTILLDSALFQRIESIYNQRDELDLDPESYRLVEETYKQHVRAGAKLSAEDKETLKSMNSELASLTTKFSKNVLGEVNSKAIVVDTAEQLKGLSETEIASAAAAAEARDLPGKYVLPLLNTTGQPALSSLEDRALRERIHSTSVGRGSSGGEFDNRTVFNRIIQLRAERAQLLGYDNHATYRLESQTAKTTGAVNERLASLSAPAVNNARKEAADLQTLITREGGDFELEAWDWSYYAQKLKAERYEFDDAQLKPYLEMNNVLVNGVFFAAEQVFGLTFKPRPDLATYHEDVKVWEVFDADGETLALFTEDFYARESKRGGAWMNSYIDQSHLYDTLPVVNNHLNVPKPPPGEPTLLTWAEVTTMFHEFGHALHGIFSDVRYPSFSGTSVPRDFVEYPSQVNEMWASWPEVLANYAVHYETGEAMPPELLEKVLAASQFNAGFGTTEALSAALLDQAWHQITPEEAPGAEGLLEFEANALETAGVSFKPVPPRYRTTYFSHITGGYSAGYYSYSWSEVLDADSVEWFKENGGMTRANGDHFRKTLLSRGGAEDAMSLFKDFRGREPDIGPLLVRKGLTGN